MQQPVQLHQGRHSRAELRDTAVLEGAVAPDLRLAQEALAGFDWMTLHLSPVYAGLGVRHGRGQPVVLVPGMLASNASLIELRGWLRRIGYAPYVAEIGRNAGCPERVLGRVIESIDRACEETGERVTVVGHSLGGLIARAAALARPERVARVVTLGAPVNGCRVHPLVALAGILTRGGCDGACMASFQDPLPYGVDEVSIYSKTDGIVHWRTCRREDAPSIEVRGTHCGMIVNAEVYTALGRILASPLTRRSASIQRVTLPVLTVPTQTPRIAA